MIRDTRITRGGQISIPAGVRRRWATERVAVEDQGDRLVVRPLPADPIGAAIGSLRLAPGVTTDILRRQARLEDQGDGDETAPGDVITILDAFALIATLVGEPAAGDVEALLRSPDADARITAVNLAEVIDRLVRTGGVAGPAVAESLSSLEDGGLVVVSVDAALGRAAGALRARHYRRRDSAVSLADCVALAAARIVNGALATSDPALARAARLDGVGVLALPDSLGIRP